MENINLEYYYFLFYIAQLVHSVEELTSGFHKKWYLFKMPFWQFLTFEIVFTSFWTLVLLYHQLPFREDLMAFFIILMFANGIQHLIWAAISRKYVPGLVTAPIHIVLFLLFYFQLFK